MNTSRVIFSAFVVLSSLGCGGGGGGGDSTPFFGGIYRVVTILTENACNLDINSVQNFTHTVNQDGTRVVLNSGIAVFEGSVNEEGDGFIVTWRDAGSGCVIDQGYSYEESTSGDADFDVVFLQTDNCLGCTVSLVGTATLE